MVREVESLHSKGVLSDEQRDQVLKFFCPRMVEKTLAEHVGRIVQAALVFSV